MQKYVERKYNRIVIQQNKFYGVDNEDDQVRIGKNKTERTRSLVLTKQGKAKTPNRCNRG
jgi:hypothetical protein